VGCPAGGGEEERELPRQGYQGGEGRQERIVDYCFVLTSLSLVLLLTSHFASLFTPPQSSPNDIIGILSDYSSIKRLVFPRTSAMFFIKHFTDVLKSPSPPSPFTFYICDDVGTESRGVFIKTAHKNVKVGPRSEMLKSQSQSLSQRVIELVVVPSTSPANCRKGATPSYKEKTWLVGCYGWSTSVPKQDYKCACCGEVGNHYTVDCAIYKDEERRKVWTENRKRMNKEQAKVRRRLAGATRQQHYYVALLND